MTTRRETARATLAKLEEIRRWNGIRVPSKEEVEGLLGTIEELRETADDLLGIVEYELCLHTSECCETTVRLARRAGGKPDQPCATIHAARALLGRAGPGDDDEA